MGDDEAEEERVRHCRSKNLLPAAMEGAPGVIWIDCNTAGFGTVPEVEPPPPQPAITAAITARQTNTDEICNFFMRVFPLVTLDPKIRPEV
jgi:hypothetical protein